MNEQVTIVAVRVRGRLAAMAASLLLLAGSSVDVKAETPADITGMPADSSFVCRMLDECRQQPATSNFPLFFARHFLARPYVASTLEVNDEERLVVNTRELDCTTLVENVTALTLCAYRHLYTYRDYLNMLVSLRYRSGIMNGYASRLHYFTDWILDNEKKGNVSEIQRPDPPFSAVQTISVNYMSTHSDKYKALRQHPASVADIARAEKYLSGMTFRYIPKQKVLNTAAMRRAVKDGDIIAITCKKPGLDIAHLGFAVWRKDGVHLLNASMIHKKVVEEPMTLGQYLQKHPSHTGIRIVRINR